MSEIEEGEVDEREEVEEELVTPAAPTKKKRSRPVAKKTLGGPGVIVVGKRFVCAYSGQLREEVIVVPDTDHSTYFDDAVFANLPCAFAWIEENIKDVARQDKLKQDLCESYGQNKGTCIRAPLRTLLSDFGGAQYYDEWIGPLRHWDTHAQQHGTTVAEWQSRKNSVTNKKKGGQNRITFEPAMYVISHGKMAAGCKKVNAIDGVAVEKGAKNVITPVKAYRKLMMHVNGYSTPAEGDIPATCPLAIRHKDFDGYTMTYIVPALGAALPDKKTHNQIASLLADDEVYGPAIAVFTRKNVLKL